MKRLLLLIATLFTLAGHSQILPTQHGWQKVNIVPAGAISTPKFAFTEVYRNTMSVSWTVPTNATNTIVQYSTDKNFTTTNTVYSGPSSIGNGQLVDLTGLTENTRYYFRVKSTGAGGAASSWVTDSIKTFWTPPGNYRFATTADLSINPFINVGDYIIDGWNSYGEYGVFGQGVGGYYGLQVPKLAAGKKVCILGGRGYDYITLDMSLNQGSAGNPVVVTNIGGQVKARLYIANCRNVKITGKYDPINKTGDAEFQGFDKSDWSKLNGSFGFYVKGQWSHPEVILSHVHGDTDSTTIEYIETGEGGYSGMTVKNDNGTVPMRGMIIRYCYTHDTGGEAYYIGSTQPAPQMPVVDFEIANNVIARAGLNGLQVGNMKGNNYIHNNVVMQSAFEWNNSFMKFQDQAIQFGSREQGLVYTGNMACGTGGDFLNWFNSPDTLSDHPTVSQTTTVSNNLFLDSKSHGGGYIPSIGPTSNGTINHSNNSYGNLGKNNGYNVIFTTEAPHDYVLGMEPINGGQMTFNGTNNQFDMTFLPGSVLARKNPANTTLITINLSGNTQVNSIARPAFSNYADGMFDNDYSAGERWVNAQCAQWNYANRENTAFKNIVNSNLTTSTSTINIPTVHPTTVALVIGTGKTDYKVGYKVIVTSGSNSFNGTIISYNPSTGELFLSSISNTGTGTYSAWNVSLDIESIVIQRIYGLNDIVRCNGRFFKSLHADNAGNQPTGNTDSHWQLIVFSNGSTMPPDDVRLPSTDVYAVQGMGLTQTAPTSFITELRNNNPYTNNKYTLR